jgi:methyl-accepting chemotaxis protein
MRAAAEHDAERQNLQSEVAETVFGASQMVASAAVELNASAEALEHSTDTAVERTDEAMDTVNELERSSAEIQQAATVISGVAAQTRLLALNATIEAARAGAAGRGFAVVAQEVKSLADEAATAAETIRQQIANAQAGAAAAIQAIQAIVATVREVDTQVEEILCAAGGRQDGSGAGGLAQMAERLHAETGRLLSEHTTG